MNLIIDIGNTRTKLGVFGKQKLLAKTTFEKGWTLKALQAFIGKRKIVNAALSTVAGIEGEIESFLKEKYFFINLSAATKIPIKNAYRSPKTLGKDRLAAVVGAWGLFPGKSCLVIDAGTCITYDFINAKGIYLGGSITPGINMRLKAMNAFTASLPLVERRKLTAPVGKDTVTSLRTGAQLGATLELEGFIRQYKERFGRLNVILTGGDANYFANKLKSKIFVNSNLVLVGLNQILNYNVQTLE